MMLMNPVPFGIAVGLMLGWQTAKKCGRRPPMSHLSHTWKTAAVMRDLRRPRVVVSQSSTDLRRIWKREMKKKGTKKAMRAAAKMGTISLRRG
jgi:hypothetical protein